MTPIDGTEQPVSPAVKTSANFVKQKNSKPKFNVQADTVSATPRKKNPKPAQPIGIRKSTPQKYYSVQIGAFRLQSNIDNNKKVLEKRFGQPVIIFYQKGIKLTRICVGNFATKSAADIFLSAMKSQYPKDYSDAWVAELKK